MAHDRFDRKSSNLPGASVTADCLPVPSHRIRTACRTRYEAARAVVAKIRVICAVLTGLAHSDSQRSSASLNRSTRQDQRHQSDKEGNVVPEGKPGP